MRQVTKPVISRSKRHVPPRGIYGERFEYWWDLTPGLVARIKEYGRVIFEKMDSGEQCIVESQTLLKHLTKQRQTSRKAHPWGIRVLIGHPNEIAIEPGPRGAGGWERIPVKWYPSKTYLGYIGEIYWRSKCFEGMRNAFGTESMKTLQSYRRQMEEDWYRFFMGDLTGPVPETYMLKIRVRDGSKAGIYYFVLFRFSIKAAIDSEEVVAIVSDANGNLDQSLSERFLDIVRGNLSKDWIQPNLSYNPEVFVTLRDKALAFLSGIKGRRELIEHNRSDALIAIWLAAIEQAFEAQKRWATDRLKAATDDKVRRMYQEVLRRLESGLQNARAKLEANKKVSIVYEPVAYGVTELLGA